MLNADVSDPRSVDEQHDDGDNVAAEDDDDHRVSDDLIFRVSCQPHICGGTIRRQVAKKETHTSW